MTRNLIPRSDNTSAKIVEASDFEKYFDNDLMNDYIACGFVLSAGSGLVVNVAAGNGRLNGLYLDSTTQESVTCLTACSTNYIYATICRDASAEPEAWNLTKNTSGTIPADSMVLGTATTNGSSVTAVSQIPEVDGGITGLNTSISTGTKSCWLFGNGVDGAVTISADTTLSTMKFYKDLTINACKTLDFTTGNKDPSVLYVRCTLTVNGTITPRILDGGGLAGAAGATTAGGAGGGGGSPSNSLHGVAGSAGAGGSVGSVGTPGTGGGIGGAGGQGGGSVPGVGGLGGCGYHNSRNGGAGGAAGPTATHAGGAATTTTAYAVCFNSIAEYLYKDTRVRSDGAGGSSGGTSPSGSGGGGGIYGNNSGSGGGAGGAPVGGAGGAGGATLVIIAKDIVVGSGGVIKSNGVVGSQGTNGSGAAGAIKTGDYQAGAGGGGGGGGSGAGAGGGGGGGTILLIYQNLTETGTIQATGGAGGAVNTAAGAGGAGGVSQQSLPDTGQNGAAGTASAASPGPASSAGGTGASGNIIRHRI